MPSVQDLARSPVASALLGLRRFTGGSRPAGRLPGNRPAPADHDVATAYELIYVAGAGKNYAAEARDVAELISARRPDAASLLDVACGTGLHLSHLRGRLEHVEGLELAEAMRAAAARRLPGTTVHSGDMRRFSLGRTFDAVTCLFSAIGYARTRTELDQTLACLAAHLRPGGVLVLEPWYTPGQWRTGPVHAGTATDGHYQVARMCYSQRSGTTSTMTMHYLLGEPGSGIRSWTERHVMSLFTDEQYDAALARAGFTDVERRPGWRDERALIVATRS